MQFHDALTLDQRLRSQDGYLKVRARAARSGVYDYLGAEVDPEGKTFKATETVKVYRPADEVFSKASLASFALKPITDDHPSVAVDANNWRDHARGAIIGAVKDGDYVGFDLAFMDAATVNKVDAGKVELSNGYSCDLSFEDGVSPDGTAYQAVQRNIRGNHVALVARGRAGPECRVADGRKFALCDANPAALAAITKEDRVKVINLDGLTVNTGDAQAAESAITTLDNKLTTALADKAKADNDLAAAVTAKATADAEITTLKQQLADEKLTPAQMRDAAKAYAQTVDRAKALGVTVSDEMDEAAIMKAAVMAKIGDAAKEWNDAQFAASFATLTADAKPVVQSLTPRASVVADAAASISTLRAARFA